MHGTAAATSAIDNDTPFSPSGPRPSSGPVQLARLRFGPASPGRKPSNWISALDVGSA
jgi:hypothetical protein